METFVKGISVRSNFDPIRSVDLKEEKEQFYNARFFTRLIIAREDRSRDCHFVALVPRPNEDDLHTRYDIGIVLTDTIDVIANAFGRSSDELAAMLLAAENKE